MEKKVYPGAVFSQKEKTKQKRPGYLQRKKGIKR